MKYPIGIFLTGVLCITACTARPISVTENTRPAGTPQFTLSPSPLPPAAIPSSTSLLQTPTSTLQPTSIQTAPPFLLFTPIPTIIPSEEQRMVDLLHSDNCKLPCYLGITPGKTSWEEAQRILESIGASSSGEWKEGNLPVYGYNLWVGDPSMATVTPDNNTGVGDLEIAQRIGFTVENDLVQRIEVSIQTIRFVEKYRDYWLRYELGEVLKRIGQPVKIFIWISKRGIGYGMLVIYEDLGIFLDYSGIQSGTSICPLLQEKQQSMQEMTLMNRNALSDIYPPGKVPPTDREVYLPIKDALGIDEKEFYNRLLIDPLTCFEIKEAN